MRSLTTCICCGLLAIAVYEVKRPGPGRRESAAALEPVASAGTLFLRPLWDASRLWQVDAAGGARALPEGVDGEPSRELHNGVRWFLTTKQFSNETYPDGSTRRQLCVLDEDGRAIQLTDSPDIEPLPLVARWPMHGQDRMVSWVARRWDSAGRVVEAGIYTAQLKINDEGEFTGLLAEPRLPLIPLPFAIDSGQPAMPDICAYDWSPDGQYIVCETQNQTLKIISIHSGLSRALTEVRGCDPCWSPDGETIAFKIMEPFGAIATIHPDGTSMERAVYGQTGEQIVFAPIFSPGGAQLAHARMCSLPSLESVVSDGVSTWTCLRGAGQAAHSLLNVPAGLVPVAWRSNS